MASPQQVKERWEKGVKTVRKQITEYRLNMSFIEGEQWVYQDPQTHELRQVRRADPDRVRTTFNKLLPAERTLMGLLFARPLVWDVPPTDADDATVAAAYLATQILYDYTLRQGWEQHRRDLGLVTFEGGTGAVFLEWDPNAGRQLKATTDTGQPLHEGDISLDVASMGEFCVTPGARNAETAQWVIKAVALPPEQVKVDFGLSDEPKPDTTAVTTPLMRAGGDAKEALTTVYTLYERPHRGSERGEHTVIIGGEQVFTQEWPFPFADSLNIAVSRETARHGKWAGITVLSDARRPQTAYNQAVSSIIEHMKNAGNARLWMEWVDYQNADELTDTPGEIAGYHGERPPTYVAPAAMPGWWERQPERISAVIQELLGTTDVLSGVAPRNVESGMGLQILSENAQSPLGRAAYESARAFGRIGTLALRTLEAKVTETRSGAYVNDPKELPEDFTWTGADLRGQTTAEIPLEAVAPSSRAQREAWANAQLHAGRITFEQYVRLVDVPGQRDTIQILDPHVAKAQRENIRMARGQDAMPEPWDDHAKHLTTLNLYRASESYERLSPENKARFETHAALHELAALSDAEKDYTRAQADPFTAAAANQEQTPGSMLELGGDVGRDHSGALPDGGERIGSGGGGLGEDAQDAGQLPEGGFPG